LLFLQRRDEIKMYNLSNPKQHDVKWLEAERDWAIKSFELPWSLDQPRNVGEEDSPSPSPLVHNEDQKVDPHSR